MIKKIRIFVFIFFVLAGSIYAAGQWNEERGIHFIIYYKEVPPDFVESVEKAAENYYREITENLGFTRYKGWMWDDRAKIYIYQDMDDYVNSSRQASWSHGAASARQKEIRTFPSAHGFFDSTLPHELGHIIFREFIGLKPAVPLWFEEGVAMYQEKAKRWGANRVVAQAIEDGRFMTLEELALVRLSTNTDQALVELFYAEAASIVYYMIVELGKYKFVNLCKKLKEGDSFEKALDSAYGRFRSIDDLNRAWVNYLKQ